MKPREAVRLITFCMAAMLPLAAAFAQTKGTGTSPSPTTGTGNTGTTGTRTTVPTTTQPSTTTQTNIPRPIYISGRVLLEDGKPPSESAKIERVCNGNPHAEGYTDSNGYFSIELGAQSGILQDASESGSFAGPGMAGMGGSQAGSNSSFNGMMTDRRLQNCDIRAHLNGYRSQLVSLATRGSMDNPDIGIILLHRLGPDESGTVISARSLAAPKDAKKAFEKGLEFFKKGKQEEAAKSYEKAVAVYPEYATAWCELGKIQAAHGEVDSARKSFDLAAQADPKYVDPYLQLSLLALHEQKWTELADLTDKAGKLDSFDYPQAFLFNAVANFNLHNTDLAEKSIQQAEHLDTRHQFPQIAHLHGVILAQRQDYPAAAERFRAYLKMAPGATDAEKVRAQLTQIEKMTAQNADGAAKPNEE